MSEAEWLDIFGDNLREMIAEQGMTQADFADEIGVTEATVSYYVNKKKMPGIKAIVNMAYVLNISIDELIDFGDRII